MPSSNRHRRRFAMCPPRHFDVTYSINPWMRPGGAVDPVRAFHQWDAVVETYLALGHEVRLIEPVPALPDLVFTANAGLVLGDRVLLSRFRHAERAGEEDVFAAWFRSQGFVTTKAIARNEGEGDYLVTDRFVLAGSGFRSAHDAHDEVMAFSGRAVLPLRLVDPRFYHLDTALAVLDRDTIAYWPGAFSRSSRARLRRYFPDAAVVGDEDALAFGLNACSDGHHVVMPAGAPALAAQLARRGFEPIELDMSELLKAGGAVKCCTLELRDGLPGARNQPTASEEMTS